MSEDIVYRYDFSKLPIGKGWFEKKKKYVVNEISLKFLVEREDEIFSEYELEDLLDRLGAGESRESLVEDVREAGKRERLLKRLGNVCVKRELINYSGGERGERRERVELPERGDFRYLGRGGMSVRECMRFSYESMTGRCDYEEREGRLKEREGERMRERVRENGEKFDEVLAKQVGLYAGLGLSVMEIAVLVGMKVEDLFNYYGEDMARGVAKANVAIAGKIYTEAMKGDRRLLVLWAKARMGWNEMARVEMGPEMVKTEEPITVKLTGNELERLERLCDKVGWDDERD
jgi:hypothetical protein